MRSFIILLLILFSVVSKGQHNYHLSVTDTSVTEVIKYLEATYDLRFSYDPKRLSEYRISCNIQTNDINRLLEEILLYLPYKTMSTEGVYLIIPDRNKKIEYPKVTGKVVNSLTHEPLAFAHVQGLSSGTITDLSGKFELKSTQITPYVIISYIGYKKQEVKVDASGSPLIVNLVPDASELPELIINANIELADFAEVSSFHINTSQLSSIPTLGQVDVFKSIQLVPGISATDETYSGLIVRGSGAEQNLVQMDGFTIYHLDHLFGIYSTFNPYAVSQVSLYKGGFQPRYGGRLSSVVDSRMKAPSKEGIHGGININPTSFNTYLEGPIGEKVGVLLSYRQSYYNILRSSIYDDFIEENRIGITQALDPDSDEEIRMTPDFHFFDFNSKIRYTPNPKDYIDFNLYLSGDNYNGSFTEDLEEEQFFFDITDNADWGNLGTSLNWTRFNHETLSNHFSASLSAFSSLSELVFTESYQDYSEEEEEYFDTTFVFSDLEKSNYLTDITLKWFRKQELMSSNEVEIGTEINLLNTDYDITYYEDWNENFSVNGALLSTFLQYRLHEGRLDMNAGIRGTYYNNTNTFFGEPRISGHYALTDHLKIKGAYSIHNQFLNRISITPFGNSDQFYWVLADKDLYPVMHSRHWIGGIAYNRNNWTVDIEVFDKRNSGILESEFVLYSDLIEKEDEGFDDYINHGTNHSKGIDLFVKRRTDAYTSWVSYSMARSYNRFAEINDGKRYPSALDQRHEINWVNQVNLGSWEMGSTLIYGSGRPYTPASSDLDEFIYNLEQINAARLPTYHRVDISTKYKKNFKQFDLALGCTLFNVFNQKNVKYRRFGLLFEENEQGDIIEETAIPIDLTLLGFTPNFFIELRF